MITNEKQYRSTKASIEKLARAMAHYVLRRFGVPPERARLLVVDNAAAELQAQAERR